MLEALRVPSINLGVPLISDRPEPIGHKNLRINPLWKKAQLRLEECNKHLYARDKEMAKLQRGWYEVMYSQVMHLTRESRGDGFFLGRSSWIVRKWWYGYDRPIHLPHDNQPQYGPSLFEFMDLEDKSINSHQSSIEEKVPVLV